MSQVSSNERSEQVRERYGKIAESVLTNANDGDRTWPTFPDLMASGDIITLQTPSSCCCNDPAPNTATMLYDEDALAGLPAEAAAASLGCGNPTAIAALQPGQTVLDLGSGGGIDCFLAARQVGPTGEVIGLDMTEAMLALAERNKAALGEAAANVRFVHGQIEVIPLSSTSVDVIISNCVINLSADKDAVFREAWRVLRPGGYLAVSDTVALQPFTEEMQRDAELWSACAAGSLDVATYRAKLHAAGFARVEIDGVTPTDFGISDGVEDGAAALADRLAGGLKSWIASAKILAYKS